MDVTKTLSIHDLLSIIYDYIKFGVKYPQILWKFNLFSRELHFSSGLYIVHPDFSHFLSIFLYLSCLLLKVCTAVH